MKKASIILVSILALAVLLAGCAGSTFSVTRVGSNTTIEVNNAEDGSTGETSNFSVGNGRVAVVESSLDKGELKIDFVEVTVFHSGQDNNHETVIPGDVAASVTVGAGDKEEVALEMGDYLMNFTSIGTTNGKVKVSIEKK